MPMTIYTRNSGSPDIVKRYNNIISINVITGEAFPPNHINYGAKHSKVEMWSRSKEGKLNYHEEYWVISLESN